MGDCRRKAAVREDVESHGKVCSLAFRHHQLSTAQVHADGGCKSHFRVETAERNLNVPYACYQLLGDNRDFHDFVAVDNGCFCVPADGTTAGQWCGEREVVTGFRGVTRGVVEAKVFTVHPAEEGLGQSDGHM